MPNFFRFDSELLPFVFYAPSHVIALSLIMLAGIAMWYGKSIWMRHLNRWRLLFAGALLSLDVILHIWYFQSGHWDVSYTLPLHLCSLTLICSIIMLVSKNQTLFEFTYFAGIAGALQALLTPAAILSDYPHFTFYYFFLAHGGIILACLWMIRMHGYRPRPSAPFRSLLLLNGLLIPIALINLWTDGNYFFIMHKPAQASLLDMLGPWPWYLLAMEGMAVVLFLILYLPFYIAKRRAD